jgi:hypothetical protein
VPLWLLAYQFLVARSLWVGLEPLLPVVLANHLTGKVLLVDSLCLRDVVALLVDLQFCVLTFLAFMC